MIKPEERKRRELIKERLRAKGAPISPTGFKKAVLRPFEKPGGINESQEYTSKGGCFYDFPED